MNGAAVSGEPCWTLACDVGVAAAGACFRAAGIHDGLTASKLGFLPAAQGHWHVAGVRGDADRSRRRRRRAERIGPVSRTVHDDELLGTCLQMGECIASCSRPGVELTKRTLWSGLEASSLEGHVQPAGPGRLYVRLLTANFAEAAAARVENRPAVVTDDE